MLALVIVAMYGLTSPSSGSAQTGITEPIWLTNAYRGEDLQPSWSPDGTRIAFTSARDLNTRGTFYINGEIYVMNADGRNPVRLTHNSDWDRAPAWSPDGTRIAFNSTRDGRNAIYVMNADGSNPVRLSGGFDPAWSPDGTRIAFEAGDASARGTGSLAIWAMNADGSNPLQLTQRASHGSSMDPAWSPGGTRIAFTSERNGGIFIYVMNADGSNPVRLSGGSGPAWSPDGTKIAFGSRPPQAEAVGIYVMDADGSNPVLVQLTQPEGTRLAPFNAAWSPDGAKIAFAAGRRYPDDPNSVNRQPDVDIYVVRFGGTNPGGGGNSRANLRVNAVRFTGTPASEETYRLGEQIRVAVTFSEAVTVTGTPQIGLTVGAATRQATYDATRSKGSLLVFTYTVQATDADPDGISMAADALTLNGGTISLASDTTTAAALSHAALATDDTRKVDGSTDVAEHGDSREQATLLTLTVRTTGEVGETGGDEGFQGNVGTARSAVEQAGDTDYFRVEVPGAGRLTAETTGTTDTGGALQGATGQALAEDDDGGTGSNFRVERQVQAGTYYVAVTGGESKHGIGLYTLSVRFTPIGGGTTVGDVVPPSGSGTSPKDSTPPDRGEPRGGAERHPTRIRLNTETTGRLDRAGEVDYFRVEVEEAGTVTVEATGAAAPVVYFGAEAEPLLHQSAARSARREESSEAAWPVTAGTYHLAMEEKPVLSAAEEDKWRKENGYPPRIVPIDSTVLRRQLDTYLNKFENICQISDPNQNSMTIFTKELENLRHFLEEKLRDSRKVASKDRLHMRGILNNLPWLSWGEPLPKVGHIKRSSLLGIIEVGKSRYHNYLNLPEDNTSYPEWFRKIYGGLSCVDKKKKG